MALMEPVDDGHSCQPACVNIEAQCCVLVLLTGETVPL